MLLRRVCQTQATAQAVESDTLRMLLAWSHIGSVRREKVLSGNADEKPIVQTPVSTVNWPNDSFSHETVGWSVA